MARRRDINDIDDDEDGLFDYSGESNDDKSKDILPEDAFHHRPAPDIGTFDTSVASQLVKLLVMVVIVNLYYN